jgi:hypothetical protein
MLFQPEQQVKGQHLAQVSFPSRMAESYFQHQLLASVEPRACYVQVQAGTGRHVLSETSVTEPC